MAKKTSKNKFNTDLVKALRQAVQQADRKNLNLDYQILKKPSSAKQQRQRQKSIQGQIKAAKQAQIQKFKALKLKAKKGPAITSVTHRTRAEYLEQSKGAFVNRLMERLEKSYEDWKKDYSKEIKPILNGMSYQQLDNMMMMLNLDKMYYESQSYSVNTGATGKALYEYFVQFKAE